ncbi:hypothetical protein R3P38DRAFT_2774390 [Favolaschia claudopus]|uniref:Uncharacterized protein n=1 Tax=Favolaschia claudopus TaxID=2862362 RepID=A0AAW0BYN5_9AGAR
MSQALLGLKSFFSRPTEPSQSTAKAVTPSRSPEARALACARYLEKNRAKLAEKSRLRAARNQKLLAFKKREKRAEAAEVKHGRKEANRKQEQRETARDYKVEYELMKAGAEDAFRERVMHAMWNPAPGVADSGRSGKWTLIVENTLRDLYSHPSHVTFFLLLPTSMTNNSRCSPPLHLEPGVNLDELQIYYLLTGPAAGEKQGVYSSWPGVQSLPGDHCVKYQSWELLEAAWHRCFRGSGSVRASYDAAAADLTASTLGGLYQTDDPHIAAHIARGSYIREAKALVDAEKAIRGLERANPSDDESNFFRAKTRRWHDSTTFGASFSPNTASIDLGPDIMPTSTRAAAQGISANISKIAAEEAFSEDEDMDLTLVGPSDQEEDDEPFYDPLFHQDDEDSSEDEEEEDGDEEEEDDGPVVVPAKRKRPSRAASEPPDLEPESREVVYTVSMFTAAQLKKPKSSRGPPMSDFFKLMSDADWPACKAQIRTILRTMLELEAVNLSNYDVTFTIPRHVKDPMTLQNATQYEHLVSTALQIKASPAARILIQPKLVGYCSLFRLVS